MTSAHERKKQPETVRRALLDCAARISLEQGLPAVTLQAVADAAHVTKGGLLHHFPSKQALVQAVFHDLLEQLDAEIDQLIAADAEPHGRFTRAYIRAFAKADGERTSEQWNALPLSSLTDPEMKAMWSTWYAERLARHAKTDGGTTLGLARYAADGLWLAGLLDYSGGPDESREALIEGLIAMTWKDAP
ncbi:transcriptional regulator, TetR family [Rhizobium sp. NFR07]|uniref:TetR/AcrR family transcriptional regulator n=1 Tax=Rhizobium sp. NFR07 TaxID=1566262 RepID=UPI0008F050D7|nr:TetR/AcrR family transcriptional regulator [Rhizobium sp. NFR07]SFB51852.1 transcriptional regulator, TetR family [Rhizobium sp. NFR07]